MEVVTYARFCAKCRYEFPPESIDDVPVEDDVYSVKPIEETIEDKLDISQYFELYENISELTDNAIDALKKSELNNALTFIDQSIEIDSSNSDLWALKSYILLKLNYLDDAITSADVSLNLNNFTQLAWACKAVILDKNGEDLAAISCCNEFLILNPTNADILQLKNHINDKISAV